MEKNNLDYEMKDEDSSIEEIREKEEFYQMKKTYPRSFSKKYIDFSDEILLDQDIINHFSYKGAIPNIKKIKKHDGIWKKIGIELHDVPFIKKEKENIIMDGFLTKEMCDAIDVSSPLNIPISFIDDYLNTHVWTVNVSSKNGNCVIFRKVFLPKVEDNINSTIYAHELTHAELNSVGGGIEEYVHKETLPILIEQLFADRIDQKTLERIRNNRFATVAAGIQEMQDNKEINFETRINLEAYLISTLEAFKLTNTYFQGNDKIKQEIISYINKVFEGDILTEDMLKHFESQFEEIDPNLKVLRKIR